MTLAKKILLGVLSVWFLSGCSGRFALRCEDSERYTGSGEIPPVRIPDDLTPPVESESLRIPAPVEGEVEQLEIKGPCLESPPDFYEEAAPG